MKSKNIYFKIASILTILYIAFLSLFAFDMFGEPWPWWKILVGTLIHLIPSLILIGILILAWKKPITGGVIFIVMSICFTIFFKTYQIWQSLAFLSLPLLIIGVLFVLSKKK